MLHTSMVGQNCIYTYKYNIYLVISKPKTPCIHCMYMVLTNPTYECLSPYLLYAGHSLAGGA
jgi:hypothetical protein